MVSFMPAPWPVRWTCDVSTESPLATGQAVQAASEVLWSLSGQRFGQTTVTFRPCRRTYRPTVFPGAAWDAWPGIGAGPLFGSVAWFALAADCSTCASDGCSHDNLPEIVLPAPVAQVVQVKLDGAPMVTGSYRVDNNRLLVRTDGASWPYRQNLLLDDSQAGTFSVTALYGEDVPMSGQWAVGELACQMLRALHGEDCALPPNVTSLARQGVTLTLPDLTAVIEQGRLGLRMCDLFLHSVNPHKLTQRARTYQVDGPAPRRVNT